MFIWYYPRITIQGNNPYDNLVTYKNYILNVYQDAIASKALNIFRQRHIDTLQSPFQPLSVGLDANEYEFFESDKVKYKQYYDALVQAFNDFKVKEYKTLNVLVVGAGRGPLIECAFKASKVININIKLTAIEKNKCAIISLQELAKKVPFVVVNDDIRTWVSTLSFDVILSELLGSFGDNELSPECLNGAQRLLSQYGVFIPCKYSSYLQPVSCEKIWCCARNFKEHSPLEVPYVINIQSAHFFSDPKKAFEFVHPNNTSNKRHNKLIFNNEKCDIVIHGFVGYFDAILYKEYRTSTVPGMSTPEISTWNPIYFPITTPLIVRNNEDIIINIWRTHNDTKVWYEWNVIVNKNQGVIHNVNGRCFSMSLH